MLTVIQTCCEADGGFCNAGSYCAPVKGYCCFEDEVLGTCAERAGFDLPSSAVNDRVVNPDPAVAATTRVSRTFTVTPFLTANPGPTPSYSDQEYGTKPFEDANMEFVTQFTLQIGTTCHETTASSASVTAVVQVANISASTVHRVTLSTSSSPPASASISPIVQVSMAAEKTEALMGSMFVIVVAGALTILL